jgi:hypothetical protein
MDDAAIVGGGAARPCSAARLAERPLLARSLPWQWVVMSLPLGAWKPDPTTMSRREGPRLEVEAVINGRLSRGNLRMDLVDLGLGGFAVESPIGFSAGSRHGFRFVTVAGLAVRVQADLVYCRSSGPHDGMEHYVSGFKYVVTDAREQSAIDLLIEAATAPLSFL